MSWATLAGSTVLSLRLLVPRTGVWLGDAEVDADSPPTGRVRLTLGDGAATWQATVIRSGDAFGRCSARFVGGAGGLARALPGKSYRNTSVKVLLADILGGAGERLSPTVAPALLAVQLTAWSRAAGPASAQLGALLAEVAPTSIWRVLPDGTWWAGVDAWAAAPSIEATAMREGPTLGQTVLATTDGHRLSPGTTFEGRRISALEHTATTAEIRTTLVYER
jgi:hypothetical protein